MTFSLSFLLFLVHIRKNLAATQTDRLMGSGRARSWLPVGATRRQARAAGAISTRLRSLSVRMEVGGGGGGGAAAANGSEIRDGGRARKEGI